MKILYLHQYFATPESNAGTRSYEMARRFVKNGHQVTFVTSSAALSSIYQFKEGWNVIEIEGIKLHVLHLSYSNEDSFMIRIFKFLKFSLLSTLKALKIKSDVVFATSTPLTIAFPALVYSKIKKIPLVFEVRDLWPELPIAVGVIKNSFVIKLAKIFEKYTYKNSTRLIGLSPGMCDGIARQGISREKITLATNSCDTELFDVDKSIGQHYLSNEFSFVNGRKLVVYTGTFGLINNVGYLPHLAKAMSRIDPSICFVAIGEGMEKEAVIDSAIELDVLDNNLFILSSVPKTEIVKILSAADLSLSLFGNIKEMWHNSANKLFDALASGTPIAINYGGWQKDFITEYSCGLVLDANDFVKSCKKISDFFNNNEQLNLATDNCKDLADNHFSRDIMAERLEQAIIGAVHD